MSEGERQYLHYPEMERFQAVVEGIITCFEQLHKQQRDREIRQFFHASHFVAVRQRITGWTLGSVNGTFRKREYDS